MTIAKSSKRHAPPRPAKRTPRRDGALASKPGASAAMTCPEPDCGKRCFRTKGEAKTAARQLYPGQQMRFYRCGEYHHMTSADSKTVPGFRDRDHRGVGTLPPRKEPDVPAL